MICPRCKQHAFALQFTDRGSMCRECMSKTRQFFRSPIDPEEAAQEKIGFFGWLFLFLVLCWFGLIFTLSWARLRLHLARHWLRTKSICSYCKAWLHGNPFARHHSHGICPHCKLIWESELARFRAAKLRASIPQP